MFDLDFELMSPPLMQAQYPGAAFGTIDFFFDPATGASDFGAPPGQMFQGLGFPAPSPYLGLPITDLDMLVNPPGGGSMIPFDLSPGIMDMLQTPGNIDPGSSGG